MSGCCLATALRAAALPLETEKAARRRPPVRRAFNGSLARINQSVARINPARLDVSFSGSDCFMQVLKNNKQEI